MREPHLSAEQIRVEVAAGHMIIPSNKVHLKHNLDPMCIGRASLTKINANMGASPVSSGTEAEIETAFVTLQERRAGALVIGPSTFFNTRTEKLAALALRRGVPTIYQFRPFVAAGVW